MRPLALLLVTVVVSWAAGPAEPLVGAELGREARLLAAETRRLERQPFALEPAADHAVGFRAGDACALLVPDQRLFETRAGRRTKDGAGPKAARRSARGEARAVGQLWLERLVPRAGAEPLSPDALRRVSVADEGRERSLVSFTLGLEKVRKSGRQLALHGRDGAPVLRVPLTEDKARKGAAAVALAARGLTPEGGVIELRLRGRHRAEIPVARVAG